MGCVSSKIMRRTGSFRQELRNSLQRVGGIEELLASSKNGGDQYLALLHTANTAFRKIKAELPPRQLESETKTDTPDTCESEPEEYKLPIDKEEEEVSQQKAIDSEATDKEVELKEVETINAWELLAGLEVEKNIRLQQLEPIETEETKDSRRNSIAKELEALRVPSFEFRKSGSLRDWLLQGGQVFSPGSYVTPKLGGFVLPVVE